MGYRVYSLGLYWACIRVVFFKRRIMQKKMDTTIMGYVGSRL